MDVKHYSHPDPEPPSSKKRIAPSSSASGDREGGGGGGLAGEKVCIVCTCHPNEGLDERGDNYRIYIVDLNEEDSGFDLRAPTLRLCSKFLDVAVQTSCVLDSVLYMFAVPRPPRHSSFPSSFSNPWCGTWVFTYNLSGIASDAKRVLTKDDLMKMKDTHDLKYLPDAISTPDRKKILVFSTSFTKYRDHDNHELYFEFADKPDDVDICDFEIYDPVCESWDKFAGIPNSWRVVDFCIIGYSFLDNNVMLFQTDKIGMFTLDVTLPHKPCQKYDAPLAAPRPVGGYSITIGEDFYLTPVLAYDKPECFEFPELSFFGSNTYIRPRRLITSLDARESHEFSFCVMQSEINTATLRPHVTVNIYRFHLDEYKGKMDHQGRKNSFVRPILPATTILKSVKFHLHVKVEDGWAFEPFCLFYIPSSRETS